MIKTKKLFELLDHCEAAMRAARAHLYDVHRDLAIEHALLHSPADKLLLGGEAAAAQYAAFAARDSAWPDEDILYIPCGSAASAAMAHQSVGGYYHTLMDAYWDHFDRMVDEPFRRLKNRVGET